MLTGVSQRGWPGYAAAVGGIAVVTAICAPFHATLKDTTVALAYLLVVLLVATASGSLPALIASGLGVLCFNFFFLPPVYTLTIADPQNWVALTAFFVVSITAGQLSELAKRRAAEAETVRRETRLASAHNRSLLEASLDALVTIGSDGKINDANTAIETLTGRARATLIGTDFSACFTSPESAAAVYREVLREGFVRDRPLELRHRDGHVTSVLYNASLHRDDGGRVIGVVAAARPTATSAGTPAVALSNPDVVRILGRFVTITSLFSVAVGVLSLIGLKFDIAVLKSVVPGQVIIKPNAAIMLALCGSSLWLLRSKDIEPARGVEKLAGQGLASVVALVALLSLSEHLFDWNLGIDELVFHDSNPWKAFRRVHPGLMAPITALDFLFIGLALLFLDLAIVHGSRRYRPAQLLAFVANTGAIVGLLDFILGAHRSYTHIALQTAALLFVLSSALACARPSWGLGALLVSSTYGGMLTRRLLPAAIIVPLLLGAVSWKIHSVGLLSEWSGITVMIVAMIALLAGLAVWSGQSIDRGDAERRHTETSLHRREEELREAQRLARVGSWWWDPSTDSVTWSEGLYRIAGRDPKIPPPGFKEQSSFYTPESFARMIPAVERASRMGTPFELELRMVRPDGSHRWVTSRGEAERDAGGGIVLVRGTIHDITEHKQAEQAIRESEASLSKAQGIAHVGSWHLDVVHDQLTWSDEVFRIFGIPKGTALTYESFLAATHPEDREAVDRAWTAAMHRAPYDIEHRIVVDGVVKWVRERAEIEFDRDGRAVEGTGTVQDITERKRAQEELLRINRANRALSRCNEALIRATEESTWLELVCRVIVDEAGYRFCWVGRAEHDEGKTVTAVAQAGVDEGYLKAINVTWADIERGRGPTGTCIRTGKAQIVKNTSTDPSFAPWRAEALKRGYASAIAIPLFVDDEPFGALSIYSAEPEAFRDEEVTLLGELAGDLGYGVTTLRVRAERERGEQEIRKMNAELEQRVAARTAELEAARDREAQIGFRIQQMLLLTQPPKDIPGLRLAALTIPSQRIDGDFYDFFRHSNQCLDVIVGDVMGKGTTAALLAGATKSNVLEALCHLMAMSKNTAVPEPKEIVTLAHADMVRQLIDLESFVTLSYARLDLNRRVIDLVDCGHTGMMILRARANACETVHGSNLPLGICEGEIFDQMAIPFEAGDLFLFYSDGITEMRSSEGELYGADRLSECVVQNRGLEPEALVDAIRRSTFAFAESDRLTDDLTCVVVRVSDAERSLAQLELEIGSDLNELRRAREFVRESCRTVSEGLLDQDQVALLELAVTEAASNIMKHAYHGRTDQRIQLEAEVWPDRVAIRLHHLGDSFDPTVVPSPAFDGSRESGFGIYLIAKSVDDVRYSRDERGRNCIDLVKSFNSSVLGKS